MGGKMSRNKGANFERETANALNARLGREVFARNLEQARSGGYDLSNDVGLAPECKRVEKPQFTAWIAQAQRQAKESDRLPVLIWRQNRQKSSYMVMMDEKQFCGYVEKVCTKQPAESPTQLANSGKIIKTLQSNLDASVARNLSLRYYDALKSATDNKRGK